MLTSPTPPRPFHFLPLVLTEPRFWLVKVGSLRRLSSRWLAIDQSVSDRGEAP